MSVTATMQTFTPMATAPMVQALSLTPNNPMIAVMAAVMAAVSMA